MRVKENKVRRFQQGGVMPALVTYTPTIIPGGVEESSSVSASTTKDDDKNSVKFADIKELLKDMLPSDARIVMSKANQLMNTINNSDDFMSSQFPNMINNMYMEVRALAEKAHQNYDDAQKAKDLLMTKGSLSEYAQDQYGHLFYMTKDGNIKRCSIDDSNGKMLLTYGDLLDYRRKAVNGAYKDDIMTSLSQATSMKEVMSTIDEIVDKIGNQSFTSSVYTTKRNNQVAQGLESILADARNGVYKITDTKSGSSKEQKMMAVNAVMRTLPNNQRNYLQLKAHASGSTPEEVLYEIIASRDKSIYKRDVSKDTDFDDIADKERIARAKATGSGSGQSMEMNQARAILERVGDKRIMTINNGEDNNYGLQALVNITKFRPEYNDKTGMMSMDKVLSDKTSNLSGVLDWKNATFAGANVPFTELKAFAVNDNSVYDLYLPYKVERNGSIKPDYDMFNRIQEKDRVLQELGVKDVDSKNYEAINTELKRRGIDITLDEKGSPIGQYMRFAAISAKTGRNTFDELSGTQKGLYSVIDDTAQAKRLAETTGVKADNSNWPGFGWLSPDEVIDSVIYVPVVENAVAAMTGSGENIKLDKESIGVNDIKFNESRINRPQYIRPDLSPEDILDE